MFISLANRHMQCIFKETKNQGRIDFNKKREDSTEADGLGHTPLNPITILPTTKCLSEMQSDTTTMGQTFCVLQILLHTFLDFLVNFTK